MRLVTFAVAEGSRPGALIAADGGDRVVDLSHIATDIVSLLTDSGAFASARRAVEQADPAALPAIADVALLAPVRPGKILCLGYNYRGHVPEGADPRAADPQYPDVFVKTPNVIGGPDEPVTLPVASDDIDYEGEIAIVIGRRAHRVAIESALDHVAGYTLFNDVSARDWQGRSSQWELGKCFDGFGPLGPALVTADEIADPHDLLVEVVRDGEVTVSQSTSTMIFSMAFLVHYLSLVMTLEPGDVISTGTPQKLPVAHASHRPLAHGDTVTVRVEGLGELTTTFHAAVSESVPNDDRTLAVATPKEGTA